MSLSDRIRPNMEAAPWVIEEVKKLEAEVERLRNGLRTIREELLEEDCDCPPEWPRCSSCRTRLRIQVLLKEDEP